MSSGFSRLTSCSYNLFHAPFLTQTRGTTPEGERHVNPEGEYLRKLPDAFRDFERVVSYPPNQVFVGNVSPLSIPEKPWYSAKGTADSSGKFGNIIDEPLLFGLIKFADVFDLVRLESGFSEKIKERFIRDQVLKEAELKTFEKSVSAGELRESIEKGAIPLKLGETEVGCVLSAHPTDVNLGAHTILENLVSKATSVYAARALFVKNSIDPGEVEYIVEVSEEACGDINQRGGGNFAKAVGELAGACNATGSDTRAFCAAPAHGLLQAAALVKAGVFSRVLVVAGGSIAKLGMNSKKHMEKGLPVLEDCLASFALLVEGDTPDGLILRTDVTGRHKIGSGASPQVVVKDLVADPLQKAGLNISDVDYYAPELQNSEITENAGAGNVTLANLKMIAATAVMKKEIERADINAFIAEHGLPGWAPTQGHIPSGVPALGWFLQWAREGSMSRGFVIGKGSLFLGRMTNLFDGISMLVEAPAEAASEAVFETVSCALSAEEQSSVSVGLTIPGSEGGAEELYAGARRACLGNPLIKAVPLGTPSSDPREAHAEMEDGLNRKEINGALTFHYPFPLGTATVGMVEAPGSGREMFIASTTGTTSTDRVEALVKNVVIGVSSAKAYGIKNPRVGFLNLEGAAKAMKIVKEMIAAGYEINLVESKRKEPLLRGNDVLAGTADVLVCDSLTGNTLLKMIASFSTGGEIEAAGSGYGVGLGGDVDRIVSIISRASSAAVVSNALLYMSRLIRGNVLRVFDSERGAAEKAGMGRLVGTGGGAAKSENRAQKSEDAGTASAEGPSRKAVDFGIEGIDVLELDEAVDLLKGEGIYSQSGMGCSGPVVMVADEDKEKALSVLKAHKYIS